MSSAAGRRDRSEETGRERARFFLGVRETAGYYAALAGGLREIGYPATCVDLSGHPFKYESDGWWVGISRVLAENRRSGKGPTRALWRAMQWVLTAVVMMWALPRFDVFVLTSLPRIAALATIGVLRLARKKVIVVFHGSDARPPYLDAFLIRRVGGGIPELARATGRQRSAVRAMERWAHIVICQNGIAHFLTRPFIPMLVFGVPAAVPRERAPRRASSGAVRILHAPSDPLTKGTAEIRQAVQALRDEGFAVEYAEVSGVAHQQVLAELDQADIVIDQLYSDFPMPGFATEAASLGKAVVIAGYDWGVLRQDVPPEAWPPTIQIRPDELLTTIRSLVSDPERRRIAGEQVKKFVAGRWYPSAVALRLVRLVSGSHPAAWASEPSEADAVHGYGMRPEVSRATIAALVARYGPRSLGLAHAPTVERRILARLDEAND